MTIPSNLFADVPANLPEELFQSLVEKPGLRIERIVSHGHRSPDGFWYDQDTDEWVVLLQGAARLEFENGGSQELTPGDHAWIAAHQRHRVAWTDPHQQTIWLAVHHQVAR